jgi:hypothetical protein
MKPSRGLVLRNLKSAKSRLHRKTNSKVHNQKDETRKDIYKKYADRDREKQKETSVQHINIETGCAVWKSGDSR